MRVLWLYASRKILKKYKNPTCSKTENSQTLLNSLYQISYPLVNKKVAFFVTVQL